MHECNGGGSGSTNGFLKFKERDFFGMENKPPGPTKAGGGKQPVPEVSIALSAKTINDRLDLTNFFILELAASMLLMFSCLYVPEVEHDFLKQYVSSFTITAVIMAMKDGRYFCPDGTIMVSTVMLFSGAYDENNKRNYVEYAVRVFGQVVGFVIIVAGFVLTNADILKNGIIEFNYTPTNTADPFHYALHTENRVTFEFFGTFIECISVSFALMPLLRVDSVNNVDTRYTAKSESLPPKNKDLWFAATSLGLIHYVLERVFRVTMNPFVVFMYSLAAGRNIVWENIMAQCAGLFAACLYCHLFRPSHTVLRFLVADKQ